MNTVVSRPNWVSRIVIGILVFFVLAMGVGLSILMGGMVYGEEFSPQSFNVRHFWYYRLPILQTRVTGTYYDSAVGSLAADTDLSKHLTQSVLSSGPIRWDLGEYSAGGSTKPPGDARILLEYLEATDDDDEKVWGKWSSKHEELAAELWPAVQALAIHQCYFSVPEMIRLAEAQPGIEEFKSQKAALIQRAAHLRAKERKSELDFQEARSLVLWGLEFGPHEGLESLKLELEKHSTAL